MNLTALMAGVGIGAVPLVGFVIAWARARVREATLRAEVKDLKRAIEHVTSDLEADREINLRIKETVARQEAEIYELEAEFVELASHVPAAGADAIRARIRRLLSPRVQDDTDTDRMPSEATGTSATPDP